MQNIALDRGYDTGAIHRGLELLGIAGYIPAIRFSNSPDQYGFRYLPEEDAFLCPKDETLIYTRLTCSRTTGNICAVTRFPMVLARSVKNSQPVFIVPVIEDELSPAVVIRPFIEGISV